MCEVRRDDCFDELAGQLVCTAVEIMERWGAWQAGSSEAGAMRDRLGKVREMAGVMLARVDRLGEEG